MSLYGSNCRGDYGCGGGAKTVEEIQEATGAGTVCGGCLDDIQMILDSL